MNTEIEQHVGSLSLEFVEGLLADYLQNPDSVPPDWRSYFDDMTRGNSVASGETHDAPSRSPGNGAAHGDGNGHNHAVTQIGPSFRPASLFGRPRVAETSSPAAPTAIAATSIASTPSPDTFAPPPPVPTAAAAPAAGTENWHMAVLQDRVDQLIRAYRVRGHLVAQLDPLGFPRPICPS